MTTLFSRLQFNEAAAGDKLQPVSPQVKKHLETMPQLLPEWAKTDMVNEDIGDYYSNPVANVSQQLITYCTNIQGIAGCSVTSNTSGVYAAANNLTNIGSAYIAHTDRLSGVTAINENTTTLPHLDTAINAGKTLSVLLYQVDGIDTNAPMIGSFTSLYTKDLFTSRSANIASYVAEIQNSILITTDTDPETGNVTVTYTSNLSTSRANTMISNIANVVSEMTTRKSGDETFFTNSQTLISEYSSVKKFNNLGATETGMFQDLVGSDKLKTRLNS